MNEDLTWIFTYSTNILVRLLTVNMKNCLTPKKPKMCDPILVALLKMRPHFSQSSRENATPFSGTSPLASYKDVTPPPPLRSGKRDLISQNIKNQKRDRSKVLQSWSEHEQPVLLFHNNISAGHTSFLQVYRCYWIHERNHDIIMENAAIKIV